MKISLIDCDSLVWAQLWINRERSDKDLLMSISNQMEDILTQTDADKYIGFLKNPYEKEFRRVMFSSYKANRPTAPEWFTSRKELVLSHLIDNWSCVYTINAYEVDDSISSIHYLLANKEECILTVCSVDKDMRNLSGRNYNLKTREVTISSKEEAEMNLCMQLLTGDSVDAIPGLKNVGPVKAKKILTNTYEVESPNLVEIVLARYLGHHNDLAKGLIDFAENVLQVVMRRDIDYPYELVDVPEHIKKVFNPEDLFK